jgi:hypothetical protein
MLHDDRNPPEDVIALCSMFDIRWRYVVGYAGRCWQLVASRPPRPDRPSILARRTQSTSYEDWVKILDELIAFRDAP